MTIAALQEMQASRPNYSPADLSAISVPVTVAWTAKDEFIRPDHTRYIAETILNAGLMELLGVSHLRQSKGRQFSMPRC